MASHELTGVQSSDAKMRSELAMSEQQIGQLKRNNTWLNEELQRTSNEFNEYRREKSEQLAQLQSSYESVSQDKNSLEIKTLAMERKNKELEQKVESLLEKVKYTEDLMHLSEKQFRSEMASQKKLTELYENKIAQTTEHTEELNALIRDLERQVESATLETERYMTESEKENLKSRERIKELEQDVQRLKNELAGVNEAFGSRKEAESDGVCFFMFFSCLPAIVGNLES